MPAITFLSVQEMKRYGRVTDPELNIMLQEVREIDSGYLIQETSRVKKSTRWFTWKSEEDPIEKVYHLYYSIDDVEVQILNLYMDNAPGSVFAYATKEMVMNYLMGILNGAEMQKRALTGGQDKKSD